MNNEDKILALLSEMKADIADMKADIADMKETLDEHTIALNTLIEWADDAQVVVKVPFAKTK